MRILILGSEGQVGWELINCNSNHTLIGLNKKQLDFTQLNVFSKIIEELKPDIIINTVAYNNVDGAETNKDLAYLINSEAVEVLGKISVQNNIKLIHYSTDFVFDGKKNKPYIETDEPNPLNVYGQSKLDGEQKLLKLNGPIHILRTSWIYSLRRKSFVNSILQAIENNLPLKVVDDQIGNPTWCKDLAEATFKLINISSVNYGLYHLTGMGYTSRYELAKKLVSICSKYNEIKKIKSKNLESPAIRPIYSVLDNSKIMNIYGIQLPHWVESLEKQLTIKRNV